MLVAIPFIRILEALIYYSNIFPSQPLPFINQPLSDVVISIGDTAILINYVLLVFFGLANLTVRMIKKFIRTIRS